MSQSFLYEKLLLVQTWRQTKSNANLSQEGFVGGILGLHLRALLLWCLVQTNDAGLHGHRRGGRFVSTCSVAADGAAGVGVIAPWWVSSSLASHLTKKRTTQHVWTNPTLSCNNKSLSKKRLDDLSDVMKSLWEDRGAGTYLRGFRDKRGGRARLSVQNLSTTARLDTSTRFRVRFLHAHTQIHTNAGCQGHNINCSNYYSKFQCPSAFTNT